MQQVRVLLAGSQSGLREIIERVVAKKMDIQIVGKLDGRPPGGNGGITSEDLISAVKAQDVKVVILDVEEHAPQRNLRSLPDLSQAVLSSFPSVVVVVLSSLGERAVVHSAVHVNDIGVRQLIGLICTAVEQSLTEPQTSEGPERSK